MSMDKRGDSWRFRIKHKNQLYTMTFQGTEKQAKKAHDLFKMDVKNDRIGITTKMNMAQLCDLVYKEYVKPNCRVSTQKGYKGAYNTHIIPEFGSIQVSDLKPINIQIFANKLNINLKPNTVNNILKCLSKTLTLAEQWEIIRTSPYKNIQQKRPDNKPGELLPMEEIEKLLLYYKTEKNLLHKAAFYLAIGCGLRNSEIRALIIDDIDFEKGIINVDKQMAELEIEPGVYEERPTLTKTTSSIRKVYVPSFALDTLKEYINSLPYIPITRQIFWSHITRKPITKHCLSKRFRDVVTNLDITTIRFHDLRHLQATLLINTGANVKAVSKRMGHSRTQTTLEVYTHTIDIVDRQIASDLDSIFKNEKLL